ncbi:hypothetical protein RRG08_021599 [Elysia crispata]|uniref:Uncharacterized protein n=1 Tax=Elysia crispata TaxID=231223 RepID=A0AAE0XDJ4_9GAST|nr:hypothetical protein RRG08_021599 [Elysia crispata]
MPILSPAKHSGLYHTTTHSVQKYPPAKCRTVHSGPQITTPPSQDSGVGFIKPNKGGKLAPVVPGTMTKFSTG